MLMFVNMGGGVSRKIDYVIYEGSLGSICHSSHWLKIVLKHQINISQLGALIETWGFCEDLKPIVCLTVTTPHTFDPLKMPQTL